MADNFDKDQDHLGDNWLTNWEDQCVHEWENEPNMDDRIQSEMESNAQKLWHSFQNSATSISHLYRDRCHDSVSLWIPFQNSASNVTLLYKDSLDVMRRSVELGMQLGHQRRTRDMLAWAKKKRRHVRREELVSYLCGKATPVKPRPPTATISRANSRVAMERSSPRVTGVETHDDHEETDLRPFRDALALQRLNGAMSNISVGLNPETEDSAVVAPDACNAEDDFHCFILDEISRRCEGRKRTSTGDVHMDSPTRKRSRLF